MSSQHAILHLGDADRDVMLPAPWPVGIALNGNIVAGRPDAVALIGFAQRNEPERVVKLWDDVRWQLDAARGLVPVFVGQPNGDGLANIFALIEPVSDHQYAADAAAEIRMSIVLIEHIRDSRILHHAAPSDELWPIFITMVATAWKPQVYRFRPEMLAPLGRLFARLAHDESGEFGDAVHRDSPAARSAALGALAQVKRYIGEGWKR